MDHLTKLKPKNQIELLEALKNSTPDEFGECQTKLIEVECKGSFQPDQWHWWINKDEETNCFGWGQGWKDQSSLLGNKKNIRFWVSYLWKNRKNLFVENY